MTAEMESNNVKYSWFRAFLILSLSLSAFSVVTFRLCHEGPKQNNEKRFFEDKKEGRQLTEIKSISKMAAIDNEKVLNVHVVPHTHDDVGWRKTVEQYYYGLNNTIQKACVKDILDTVVLSLLENPSRTFTYVEQKFFSMWWRQQSAGIQDSVRFLVSNQQLSFVNGGWCMHDEATTHFMGMIDQTTLGHDFLKKELGVIPKVAWQLDPFGHSATQASLLTARAGMDAIYFGRIDHEDLALRQLTQECEGLWSSSASLNDTIFWGLTGEYGGNYGPPKGFCYDIMCRDELLVGMDEAQLVEVVNKFLMKLRVQSDRTKGNHMMLTMGGDFAYQRGDIHFDSLDILVASVMNFQRWGLVDVPAVFGPRFQHVNIFYSSPEYYTEMKYRETKTNSYRGPSTASKSGINITSQLVKWSIKKDDFFPYSDCENCFWTGYFTSRAGFKRFERVASSFLLAARQIEAMPTKTVGVDGDFTPLYKLEDALGVSQHHDAVSGTEQQHVANDYSRRIQEGIDVSSRFLAQKMKDIFLGNSAKNNYLDNLSYCQLLNETICQVSQNATKGTGTDLYVIVHNALASNRSGVVRLPVSEKSLFQISRVDETSKDVKIISSIKCPLSSSPQSAKYVLMFGTDTLPPIGAAVFRVRMLSKAYRIDSSINESRGPASEFQYVNTERILESRKESELKVANGLLTAHFDSSTGMIKSVAVDDVTLDVSQSWGYYTSFDEKLDVNASSSQQNSGAYIFRPSTPNEKLHNLSPINRKPNIVDTNIGVEVHVEFEQPWIRQVTRVLKGMPYVEVEYMVGPVPIDDGRGKEIVTRFSSPIKSNAVFFTDSNGRDFIKRKRNYRPSWSLSVYEPVAGNYYPVNGAIYIEDDKASLAVLVDRSQGGSSLVDGTVELMVQRRTLCDDHRGVREAMNETVGGIAPYPPFGNATRRGEGVVIRGKHRIMVGKGGSGASVARSALDETFSDPVVFVGSSPAATEVPFKRTFFSALQDYLPRNVMLVTFLRLHGTAPSSFLIRLAHQYGVNEDKSMSNPVTVDLEKLLLGYKVTSVIETTLTGNENYNDWVNRRLDWTGTGNLPKSTVDVDKTIELKAMEIRTFVVQLDLD